MARGGSLSNIQCKILEYGLLVVAFGSSCRICAIALSDFSTIRTLCSGTIHYLANFLYLVIFDLFLVATLSRPPDVVGFIYENR